METGFFPQHLAGLIILFTALTGAVYWAIFAVGNERGQAAGTGGSGSQFRLALLLVLWYGLAYWVVSNGLMGPWRNDLGLPNLVIAMALPVAIGVALLSRPGFTRILDAVPLSWLAGFHSLRILFGIFFLAFYEMDAIPAAVGLEGGYGDIAAGILGGLAALLIVLKARPAVTWTALAVFSTVGLLDFAVVLYLGLTMLTANAPFAAFYPFLMIPVYVVPLFLLTHFYVLRAMVREFRSAGGSSAVTV